MSLEPTQYKSKIKPFEVYDIETTTDLKNVYLVGWYDGNHFRYWESKPLPPSNPASAMAQYLEWRFANPTKKPQYAHNGGNFDAVFALSYIIENRQDLRIEIIPSQSSILLMHVFDAFGHRWEFLDSARTLPDTLNNLADCFLGQHKIEVKDYDTLHINPMRYEYIKQDCVLLYNVLSRYFSLLYGCLKGQAGISAASTSLATFRASYQRRTIPEISEHAARLARAGYYGGRCEPFRREFGGLQVKEIYCYDVNSMYPWAMKQQQPVHEVNMDCLSLELAGFADCTVTVRDCHIPILPCRQNGKLLFPIGTWRGVFSTCELAFAVEQGQIADIQYHDGAYFRTEDIFSDYVDALYAFRNKDNPKWEHSLDRIAKIGLNTLYGKFGSQSVRETIHIRPDINDVFDKQMQQMPSSIHVDCYIERSTRQADYMLPQISAWITALGRCKLARQLLVADKEAYYCDTDSIYTPMKMSTGTALGEWKNEYKKDPIIYAYFLAPKVYVLKHRSGAITNKAKGFSRFAKELPSDIVAILARGEHVEVSRFAKARSVIRGDFGLMLAQKHCHMDFEKRIFSNDGRSRPRKVYIE